jgi:hypothetical protein
MGNPSTFIRELKLRFCIWYNRRHQNTGTLWSARYKSLIVEDDPEALVRVSAYIDLNPVRAGLTEDPGTYRFCSHAAAIAGDSKARVGYCSIYRMNEWEPCMRSHRMLVFEKGASLPHPAANKGKIPESSVNEVLDSEGQISMAELMRKRIRYFSDGMALGRDPFLQELFKQQRHLFPPERKTGFSAPQGGGWGDLKVMRKLRVNPVG